MYVQTSRWVNKLSEAIKWKYYAYFDFNPCMYCVRSKYLQPISGKLGRNQRESIVINIIEVLLHWETFLSHILLRKKNCLKKYNKDL